MTGRAGRPQAGPVLVLGMGATGASCARYLAARGIAATFVDTRAAPPAVAEIRSVMPEAEILAGDLPAEPGPEFRRVVVSPGVDMQLPLLVAARTAGLEVLSDLDLFAAEARAPIVAVTGSNGKSTVTALAGALLQGAGLDARVGGNLGTPALDLLDNRAEAYVLELSSFQLERSGLLPLAAAVVLNFSPDHLDRHAGMPAYRAAKARIYRETAIAVVNLDAPELADLVPMGRPVIGFGLREPGAGELGIVVHQGQEWIAFGARRLLPITDLRLCGRHNLSNALAALALGIGLDLEPEAMVPALCGFTGLPHRMQTVATHGGVTWIDDSKATNVAAALASIEGVRDPLVLIAGGEAKGQDFGALAGALRSRAAVAVLIGRDADRLAAGLGDTVPIHRAGSLEEAVHIAAGFAVPGATVLLAPACSSLDMFRDYAERGEVFRRAVLARSREVGE